MSKRTDLRRLTHTALTDFRIRAVSRVQEGCAVDDVAATLGISRSALFGWLAKYRSGGWDALNASKRGGRKPTVTSADLKWLYKVVTGNSPRQMKFPFALWTVKMLVEVLRKHRGIKLSRWSVSRLLHQIGLSPQRPNYRATKQDPEKVREWKEKIFPKIQKDAKRDGGIICFQDESGVRSDHHAGTTWAPVGETPEIKATGARFSLNIMGAISTSGAFRFMTFTGGMNAEVFIRFLARLIKGNDRKIHLVVDGHPVHRSKAVREFVEAHSELIELHFLPPYSPQLNPIELLWNHAKNHQIGKSTIVGPDQMKSVVIGALRRIQKLPNIVLGFFRHPECVYAIS